MSLLSHLTRLSTTTALAALFVAAPLSASVHVSGKLQIGSAAAHAQEIGEEPGFEGGIEGSGGASGPGLGEGPDEGPGEGSGEGEGSSEGPGLGGPDEPTTTVTQVSTGGEAGGQNRDPETQTTPDETLATANTPPTKTLTPAQQSVAKFAESLNCSDCTITVSADGAVTATGRNNGLPAVQITLKGNTMTYATNTAYGEGENVSFEVHFSVDRDDRESAEQSFREELIHSVGGWE